MHVIKLLCCYRLLETYNKGRACVGVSILQAYGGKLWDEELLFSDCMIEKDVRNNSAWNQRAFLVRHQLQQAQSKVQGDAAASREALDVLLERELEYVCAKVEIAPRNESLWNYLTGLFTLPGMHRHAMGYYAQVDSAKMSRHEQCTHLPGHQMQHNLFIEDNDTKHHAGITHALSAVISDVHLN